MTQQGRRGREAGGGGSRDLECGDLGRKQGEAVMCGELAGGGRSRRSETCNGGRGERKRRRKSEMSWTGGLVVGLLVTAMTNSKLK